MLSAPEPPVMILAEAEPVMDAAEVHARYAPRELDESGHGPDVTGKQRPAPLILLVDGQLLRGDSGRDSDLHQHVAAAEELGARRGGPDLETILRGLSAG